MSKSSANPLHPKRWTVLTWLAVLLWAWQPVIRNFPPSESYSVDPVSGELSGPTRYRRLSELPFPVGWPLYYVKPSYLAAPAVPIPAGTPMPPPAPSSVHPFAIVANFVLVVVAMSSLVYFLQKTRYRYSLLFMFAVMTAVPLYFALGPLIAMLFGREAAGWYPLAVYFSPILAALAVTFSIYPRLKWPPFRSMWMRGQPSFDDCANADDANFRRTEVGNARRLEGFN